VTHFYKIVPSPVGKLTLVANDQNLVAILWENEKPNRVRMPGTELAAAHPVLLATQKQLGEYFSGTRKQFQLPLEFNGTDFQVKVWRGLQQIPFGETRSYQQLASHVGSPKAYRAVGTANGHNPISIVVPCHRVIGADGALRGFGGGVEAKEFLLKLEGRPDAF
jgi:methylated-DNA-[protein]-cysteine S-methyltransferase